MLLNVLQWTGTNNCVAPNPTSTMVEKPCGTAILESGSSSHSPCIFPWKALQWSEPCPLASEVSTYTQDPQIIIRVTSGESLMSVPRFLQL